MTTRSHTVTWDVAEGPSPYAGMAGLEAMQAQIADGAQRSPMFALMGFQLVRAEPGLAVMQGEVGEQHYNSIGIAHGGYAATILDAALWNSIRTTLKPGEGHTTLELKVNYAKALTTKSGLVTCEGRVVSRGGRIAIAEARLTGDAGETLYAYGSSTLMILKS
ncbi:PaaI family thioesterase [Roseococcus sp. YIM B11640]|uniref:PaaI family thioesterase n=1 Tax=Roseococcus sp. YIM B11640 TaxID=3133973 RepID=UPI003C7EC5D2